MTNRAEKTKSIENSDLKLTKFVESRNLQDFCFLVVDKSEGGSYFGE